MKKQIPLVLRLELEKMDKEYPGLLKLEFLPGTASVDSSVVLKEKNDPDSPFFFRIYLATPLRIGFKPKSLDSISSVGVKDLASDRLISYFKSWVQLLEMYNAPSTLFDDPITQSYYDEIESNFHILDEDAKTAPYKFLQQKALMQVFENIKKEVDLAKKGENDQEAQAILNEIKTAQENLGKETKWKVVERLRKIVAMCMKHGYDLGVKVLETAAITEVLKMIGI